MEGGGGGGGDEEGGKQKGLQYLCTTSVSFD